MSVVATPNDSNTAPEFAFELSALQQSDSSGADAAATQDNQPPLSPTSKQPDEDEEEAGSTVGTGIWTKEEHARFLEAIKIYANGPWKLVAAYVATRTVRQTMTHAQKYRQKAARRLRGLRTKQALMRMHYGHRISEESLVQERLRVLAAQVESASTAPQPLYTPPSSTSSSRRSNSASVRKHPRPAAKTLAAAPAAPAVAAAAATSGSLLALLTDDATPPPTKRRKKSVAIAASTPTVDLPAPLGLASPCAADAIGASANILDLATDLEIIDDLSEAPSLEECAEMLYDLLCC